MENRIFEKLALENCTFSYDKKSAPVLKNINFTLEKNDFTCLVGPNGCGKSTLLRRMVTELSTRSLRSLRLSKGSKGRSFQRALEVTVATDGSRASPSDATPKQKSRLVAFLPQNETPLWNYSVFETVLQGRFCHTGAFDLYSKKDFEIVEKILEDFNLSDLKNKSIKEISGGEFQKVRLARAFAQESKFLILDEPTTSLDFVVAAKLMEELKEKAEKQGLGVLISIHDVNLALHFAKKIALLGIYDAIYDEQFFKVISMVRQSSPTAGSLTDASEDLEPALSEIYGEKIQIKTLEEGNRFLLFP